MADSLTGLPNREVFNSLTEKALADCPSGGKVAVLLMDLDRFKEINDSLGHFNGDLVIERVGKRLRTVLREGDQVARLGGDEFAMLLPNVQAKDSVAGAAQRIQEALSEPFSVGGLALKVEASIGSALYPTDVDKAGKLLQAADVAMYAAKKAHSGHEFYSPDQHQYTPARLGLVAQLNRAMEAGELVLHYQPKARLATGTVEGVEALARWNHPQRGLLFPDEFIPVTEHTSMIRPLTVHFLETALEQVESWSRQGIELNVAVNLSAQLLLDLQLPREIGRMLSRVGAARVQARGGDHRERDHVRPPPRPPRPGPDARDGHPRGHRRLRHRLLLAGVPQAAAGQHDQGRQVLRHEHGGRPRRRRHRALDRGPGPQPGPGGRGRGRRDPRRLARAAGHGGGHRPGLLPEQGAAGRPVQPLAVRLPGHVRAPAGEGIAAGRRSWRAVMGCLDIEQAARASGLTARDVRLLIERGKLPATRPAGRWLIDQRHLAAATPRPEVDGARPIGADSPEDTGTLLARLEEAQAQVADLRAERDELRLRLREQVSSLQRSLEDSMEELDETRARLAELESRRPRAVPDPSPSVTEPEPVRPPEPSSGLRARDALTPLFRATTQPRDVGAPADRD